MANTPGLGDLDKDQMFLLKEQERAVLEEFFEEINKDDPKIGFTRSRVDLYKYDVPFSCNKYVIGVDSKYVMFTGKYIPSLVGTQLGFSLGFQIFEFPDQKVTQLRGKMKGGHNFWLTPVILRKTHGTPFDIANRPYENRM